MVTLEQVKNKRHVLGNLALNRDARKIIDAGIIGGMRA